MRSARKLRRIRIVIGIASALALLAAALGVQREGMARQEGQTAISLNAPTSFPVDI